jgi:hypothetical protein
MTSEDFDDILSSDAEFELAFCVVDLGLGGCVLLRLRQEAAIIQRPNWGHSDGRIGVPDWLGSGDVTGVRGAYGARLVSGETRLLTQRQARRPAQECGTGALLTSRRTEFFRHPCQSRRRQQASWK